MMGYPIVCLPPLFLPVLFLLQACLISCAFAESTEKLYIVYMGEKQQEDPKLVTALHHDILGSIVGSKEAARSSLLYSYKHGFSGFAAMLTPSQAQKLAEDSRVVGVALSRRCRIQTTRSWKFLNMDLDHPSDLLKRSREGEDVIIGMVDTGIWPESKSFDDSGYGPIPTRWKGECQTGKDESFPINCNRKIIGARWYAGGVDKKDLEGEFISPRDLNGHGTHTASTAAGGMVRNVSFHGLAYGATRGGAPRARIAIYKSLWGKSGGGNDATVLAAIDDAIHDGVDVLSMSLAAMEDTSFSFAALHAVARGIPVVFAGGNGGPMPMSVTNTAPWVITVAASTIDRAFPTNILLGNNLTVVGQALYYGPRKDVMFRGIVLGSSCDPKELERRKTKVAGKVLLCPMGTTPQSSIVDGIASYVAKAGGKGLVVAQYAMNTLDVSHPCQTIPCVLVDFDVGTRMADYIITTRSPVVKIEHTVTAVGNQIFSPKVAGFSSRGPNTFIPGVIKPDIAAPGVNILGATGDSYVLETGTSMATPHVAGIIALLRSLHPNWSPAAIKSALITTASTTDGYGHPIAAEGLPRKPADPFDYGGGQVDPNRAANPGLVYDMRSNDFKPFVRCGKGKMVLCSPTSVPGYHMNLPSISVPDLKNTTTVSRTLTSVDDTDATYQVTFEAPSGITMDVRPRTLAFTRACRVRTYEVTFSTVRKVQGDYGFGSLTWCGGSSGAGGRSVRIPVAVRAVVTDFYSDAS